MKIKTLQVHLPETDLNALKEAKKIAIGRGTWELFFAKVCEMYGTATKEQKEALK